MIKKLTLALAASSMLSYGLSAFAAESTTDSTMQQEITALKKQLAALEAKVKDQESATASTASSVSSTSSTAPQLKTSSDVAELVPAGRVIVANYVGVEPEYTGFNLIVNNPGVNNDVALLKLRKAEADAYKAAGVDYPDQTSVIFSGEVEGTSVYTTPYNSTPAGTNFNLTDAELDTFVEGNRWVSGFMTFTYNTGSDGEANEVNNSELQLGQGFITIGDLATTPFYGSAGQMYMPFGRYFNYMVSSPSTKTLGRIQARGITLGYHSTDSELAPFAAVYGYQGATEINGNPASNDDVESYGANLGLNFFHGDYSATLGMSYTSDIADSSGLQGDGSAGSGFSQSSSSEQLANRVPGIDLNGLVSYKNVSLASEFVEATEEFAYQNLSYNGHGAQPKALDIQAAYSFELWRPSYIAADYGQSWEALALGVPAKNYGIVYGTAPWRNTALSLELMHNIGYSNSDTSNLDDSPTTNNSTQGASYNTVSLRFDLFF